MVFDSFVILFVRMHNFVVLKLYISTTAIYLSTIEGMGEAFCTPTSKKIFIFPFNCIGKILGF